MAAKDKFHAAVRIALEKEQWKITDDPLRLEVGGTKLEIDLGAEHLLTEDNIYSKLVTKLYGYEVFGMATAELNNAPIQVCKPLNE